MSRDRRRRAYACLRTRLVPWGGSLFALGFGSLFAPLDTVWCEHGWPEGHPEQTDARYQVQLGLVGK